MATPEKIQLTNVDIIKKKLNDLTNPNKAKKFIWKPTAENSVIRILPYIYSSDPFNILYFHYNVGGKNALCPTTFGKECPICESIAASRAEAKTRGKEASERQYELTKEIAAKRRVFIPIIVREHENEGPKFWGVSKTIYETLMNFFVDADYGDLSHPSEGFDIKVKYQAPDKQNRFGKIDVQPMRKSTPLSEDKAKAVEYIKSVPNIFEIYPEQSSAELAKILENYLSPQESPKVESSGDEDDIGTIVEKRSNVVTDASSPDYDIESLFTKS